MLPFASFMLETIFNLNYSVRDVEKSQFTKSFKMELNKNKFSNRGTLSKEHKLMFIFVVHLFFSPSLMKGWKVTESFSLALCNDSKRHGWKVVLTQTFSFKIIPAASVRESVESLKKIMISQFHKKVSEIYCVRKQFYGANAKVLITEKRKKILDINVCCNRRKFF